MFTTKLNPKILYEDDSLLVIDKPFGFTVNKSETVKNQETIQEWAEKKLIKQIENEPETDFAKRGGIVHRLDKETSGALLIAKNDKTFKNLQLQFKERNIKKKYQVLVHGILEQKEGVINAPIDRLPWNRERFGVFPGGRESITNYKIIGLYEKNGENFTLVEVTPHTGRTHQIRVHFKYLNHPVVGDALYGGRKQGRNDRFLCERQFLHAKYLEFTHPKNGQKVVIESELPSDLHIFLSLLTPID